jgi:hypothetical protein
MPTTPNLDLRIALEAALNRKVPDNFIGNYRDFVKWRDLLPHMRYNPKVMHALAQIAVDVWHGTERVNRYELLRCMVRYRTRTRTLPVAYYGPKEVPTLDLLPETDALLFGLCLQIMTSRHLPVSNAQAADMKRYANVLMMRVRLNDDRVDEMVMALPEEPALINRLLRYAEPSAAISHWARQEMQHTEWAYRRGEVVAWVLNENPKYVVSDALLRADFEEMNRRDSEIAARHLQTAQQQVRLQHDFPDLFSEPEEVLGFLYSEDEKRMRKQDEALRRLNEIFPIRPGMKMPMTYSQTLKIYLPDTAAGKRVFEDNLDKIRSNCMLRAVRHCHLPAKTKLALFKKHYHPANDFQAVTIAKSLGHAGMLRWLLENGEREKGVRQ